MGVNLNGEDTYLGPAGDLGDLGVAPTVLMTGTPLAFRMAASGTAITIGVFTADGTRDLGSTPELADAPRAHLIEGNRWALDSISSFPYIVDAARGALTYLGDGFGYSPVITDFFPGAQG